MSEYCLQWDWKSLQTSWLASSITLRKRNKIIQRDGLPLAYPTWRKSLTMTPSLVPFNYSLLKGLEGERQISKDISDLDLNQTINYFARLLGCKKNSICFMHAKCIVNSGKPTKTLFFICDESLKDAGFIRTRFFHPYGQDERLWYSPWETNSVDFVRRNAHKHFEYFIDLNCLRIYQSKRLINS